MLFYPMVEKLANAAGSIEFINTKNFANAGMFLPQFQNELFTSGNMQYIQNTFIDVLNKASSAEWRAL